MLMQPLEHAVNEPASRTELRVSHPGTLGLDTGGAIVAGSYFVIAVCSWFFWPVRSAGSGLLGGYAVLLAVATYQTCQLLWRVRRTPIDASHVQAAWRWTVLMIAIAVITYPPLSGDMSYYIATGRLVARGGDVYTDFISPGDAEGLFLRPGYNLARFPYGPLWAWLSAVVASIGRRRVLLELLLMKAMIGTAYGVTVASVRHLIGPDLPRKQLLALLITGWLPIGVHVIVADGHNEGVMMGLALLGLLALARSSRIAPFWLIASVLVKYVTVPLLLVAAWRYRRERAWTELALLGVLGTLLAILVWPIFSSPQTRAAFRTEWQFYSPAHAIRWAIPDPTLASILLWLFRGSLVLWFVRTWRATRDRDLSINWNVMAVGSICLLLGAGYLWPWYLWWSLPFVALSQRSSEMRVMLPLAVLLPLIDVIWLPTGESPWRGTIVLYSGLIAGFLALWAFENAARHSPPFRADAACGPRFP
jgi:hypothetical protein